MRRISVSGNVGCPTALPSGRFASEVVVVLLSGLQNLIDWVLFGLFAIIKIWAFVDCLRQSERAFPAVGRQSKLLWLILTGIAALTGLVVGPLNLIGIAGLVVALVYLFDVKVKVGEISR